MCKSVEFIPTPRALFKAAAPLDSSYLYLRISFATASLLSLAMVENFLGKCLSLPLTFPLAVVHDGIGQ